MLNLLERTNGWCDVLEHVQSREDPPKPFLNEYLPTPEEISRACLEIQSEWTESERRRRRGYRRTLQRPAQLRIVRAAFSG